VSKNCHEEERKKHQFLQFPRSREGRRILLCGDPVGGKDVQYWTPSLPFALGEGYFTSIIFIDARKFPALNLQM
jgi:hypothetical protein